jgi:hypothetical protein
MMEIVCTKCSKEFELLKNKNYLGIPFNVGKEYEFDPLSDTELIALCSGCYSVELSKLKKEQDRYRETDGED